MLLKICNRSLRVRHDCAFPWQENDALSPVYAYPQVVKEVLFVPLFLEISSQKMH